MSVVAIAIIVLLLSFAGIVTILVRKASLLTSIDVATIPAERESKVKDKIIRERMERQLFSVRSYLALALKPLGRFGKILTHRRKRLHDWLLDLREAHKKKAVVGGAYVQEEGNEKIHMIEALLDEADDCFEDEKYESAEKKFIEVISYDAHNVDAYVGLSDVYRAMREWQQAKEVLRHAAKLLQDSQDQQEPGEALGSHTQEFALVMNDLYEVHTQLHEYSEALECVKQAVELDKNNPKYLSAQVDAYIMLRQKLRAERALEQLRVANPENQKLPEIEKRIADLRY